MTKAGVVLIALFLTCSTCVAAVTHVATFENYNEGDNFKPSFTDPLSGITFHNSTNVTGGFVIDYSSSFFGGSKYLSSGGDVAGPGGGLGANFGFTADLPNPADNLSIDVTYFGSGATNLVSLTSFDSNGNIISQEFGPTGALNTFTLDVSSAQFNITRFQLQVPTNFSSGYDNVAYTIAPEPVSLMSFAILILGAGRCVRR